MNDHDLTPYGPGKFNLLIDEVAYNIMMNGPDDEIGDCSEIGWCASIVRGISLDPPFADIGSTTREKLSKADLAFIRKHKHGFILVENDQGFVYVEWFTNKRERERRWKKLEREWEEFSRQEED